MIKKIKPGVLIGVGAVAVDAGIAVFNRHFKHVKPTWNYCWDNNSDIDKIQERMLEDLYDKQADPSECIANLNEDGSFKNVDYYTDKKNVWHPAKHLDNILLMQSAAYTKGNVYCSDGKILDAIAKAIEFWVKKDFVCNWNGWWNHLGIGPKIADILLFSNDDMSPEIIKKLSDKMYGITVFDNTRLYNVRQREIDLTGGNLTDAVNHSLKYAVIKKDGQGIKFLRRLMENELRPFPANTLSAHRWDVEGIKADMSFQQHFEHLYMGGYGEVFCDGMNQFIRYTQGT